MTNDSYNIPGLQAANKVPQPIKTPENQDSKPDSSMLPNVASQVSEVVSGKPELADQQELNNMSKGSASTQGGAQNPQSASQTSSASDTNATQ